MSEVSFPNDSRPYIQHNHIDGAVLYCHDGAMHWLTTQEKIWLKFGFTTIEKLDQKYCYDDCRG
jgi:hypothetical protein